MEFKVSLDWGKKKALTQTKTIPEVWGNSIFYPLQSTDQNNKALIDMYNELPEFAIPTNYIIDILSIIPYNHIRNGEVVENSDVIKTLKTPNQYQTENDFIKIFFLNRIVLGIGYINRIKAMNKARQLYVLSTAKTEPVLEDKNIKDYRLNSIVGYKVELNGETLTLDKDEVFVQRESSLIENNYIDARSRLMAAIMTSDSLRNNYEARIKLISDRGAVAIVSPKDTNDTITTEQAKTMREKFFGTFGLTGNKQPIAVLPRGVDVSQIGMNAGELELLDNKTKDFSIVCNVLGLDPSLFGVGQTTYNNKKLASTSAYENVLVPYFNNYLQLLENIFELPDNESLVADYSAISAMQEDYDKLVTSNSKLYNDGAIWQSEYRAAAGLEGGEDKYKSEIEKENELSGESTNQNE